MRNKALTYKFWVFTIQSITAQDPPVCAMFQETNWSLGRPTTQALSMLIWAVVHPYGDKYLLRMWVSFLPSETQLPTTILRLIECLIYIMPDLHTYITASDKQTYFTKGVIGVGPGLQVSLLIPDISSSKIASLTEQ